MGFFRFSRRIKILPGVSINLSKSGVSASVGPRGAKVTIGKRGVRANLGIPGTGMGYSTKITSFDGQSNDSGGSSQEAPAPYRAPRPNPTGFAPRNAPNPTGFAARSSAPEQEADDEPSHLPEAYPAEAPAEESGGCSMGCVATLLLIAFGLFLLSVIAKS